MNYLGKSGLRVSEICLGTLTFGSTGRFNEVGKVGEIEAKELIKIALDAGINFFDTADSYSFGASEKALAKALGKKRKDVIICTKVRYSDGSGNPNNEGCSRYHIINACNNSLRRLNTDYIDIYMLHSIDLATPLEETLRALDDLVRHGKIRYIACSNFSAWYLMKAICITEKLNLEKFIAYQGYYSLIARELENEIIPLCSDQGLGLMAWSPLCGGYLTDKLRNGKTFPKGTRIGDNEKSDFIPPINVNDTLKAIKKLKEISDNNDKSIAQVALNYILNKSAVSSVVIGVRTKKQLEDNIKSTEWKLTSNEINELDNASDIQKIYPYWYHILNKQRT